MTLSLGRLKKPLLALLLTVAISLLLLLGTITAVLNTEGGTRLALSFGLDRINALPGQSLSFGASQGTLVSGLTLENLIYASESLQFSTREARISWLPYSLLSGDLIINDISLQDSLLQLSATDESSAATSQPPLGDFQPLPVDVNIDNFSLQGFTLQQGEQSNTLDAVDFSLNMQGHDLRISDLALASNLLTVSGTLQLTLTDSIPVDAVMDWQYDSSPIPQYESFSGQLTLAGNLGTLTVQHSLRQPLDIATSGTVATGVFEGDLALELTHSADTLIPPLAPDYELVLNAVSLSTFGNLENLQLSLDTQLASAVVQSASLSSTATLAGERLTVTDLSLDTASGRVAGNGAITFAEDIGGELTYQLQEANPLAYWPTESPLAISNLASEGNINFSVANGSVTGLWQLSTVTGDFDSYPFEASGRLGYTDGSLSINEFQLATRDNRLTVNGNYTDALDLGWSLDAPQLDQFMPGLGGRLQAEGLLTGTVDNPQLRASASAGGIRYQGLALDDLQLQFTGHQDAVDGSLVVTDVSFMSDAESTYTVDSLIVGLAGTTSDHQISLEAASDLGALSLLLVGTLQDLSARHWEGNLQQATIDSPLDSWVLEQTTSIVLNGSAFSLGQSCWLLDDTSLCTSLSGQLETPTPTLQGAGQIRNLALTFLNHPDRRDSEPAPALAGLSYLPGNAELSGNIDGEFTFALDSNAGMQLDLTLQPIGVEIVLFEEATDDDAETIAMVPAQSYSLLPDSTFVAQLERDTWNLQATSRISGGVISDSMPLLGTIDSRMRIDSEQNLAGDISAEVDNIGWLETFTTDLENLSGQLNGNVDINGSLDAPQILMDLQLTNVEFAVVPLGISVSEFNASAISQANDRITLTANAASGAGRLELAGMIIEPFTAQLQIQATLAGEAFELANLPDVTLSISPQLDIDAGREAIDVNGDLHFPTLTVSLAALPETAVDVSRDAVVISYPPDQPDLAQSIGSEQATLFNRPVNANVDITLGDDVNFSGFGLTTRVAGNLNVQQRPDGNNLTYGELEIVDGSYQLYGRTLQIRQGKLLFFGAYDNPALDIRAAREVDGTTVGVLMNGTLKNIRSQLYSTPTLADSDIIAMIVTGRPFSELGQQEGNAVVGAIANLGLSRSQGLTNQVREQLGLDTLAIANTGNINNSILTIGKFLTPDLFIRYGIGLFDHQSKLALDYYLSERFTLQAETGEYQSVDLLYKVER